MFGILIILVTTIVSSNTCHRVCQNVPDKPQLSTTFLKGYWYEHLFFNQSLTYDHSCSYFNISCTADNSSCHVERHPYPSSGMISENQAGVNLTINDSLSFNVNLKFHEETVVIWSCNENETEFASVLVRITDDQDIEKVWFNASNNMNYLKIIDEFPAGLWNKADTKGCNDSGGTSVQMLSSLAFLWIAVPLVQKIFIM